MAGFYGADTEALRTLADRFREGSRRIEELQSTLGPVVTDESIWHGTDAEQFRSQWSSEVASRLGSVVDGVEKRHVDLGEQADQQDEASDPGGDGGGGAGGEGKGEGDSAWDRAITQAKILSKEYSLYKTASHLADDIADSKLVRAMEKMGDEAGIALVNARRLADAPGGFQRALKTAGGLTDLPGLNHLGDWAGKKIDALPAKLGEGGKLMDALGTAGRGLGKFMPGVDIVAGVTQMATADDGYSMVSGGLSTVGGALMVAGIACPPLAVVGGAMTAASLVMDLGDLGGELFGADPSKAVSDFASDAAGAVGNAAKDVGGAIKDGLGSIF